jgi:hypothetical protein
VIISFVILVIAYAIIVWRVLGVEDSARRSSAAVLDLQYRVGRLEDQLALIRNEQLAAARDQ